MTWVGAVVLGIQIGTLAVFIAWIGYTPLWIAAIIIYIAHAVGAGRLSVHYNPKSRPPSS